MEVTDGANDGNGWRGRIDEKVSQLETWKGEHMKHHEVMTQELRESTRRNDRWSGALALLILLLGIVGPIIAAKIAEGHR